MCSARRLVGVLSSAVSALRRSNTATQYRLANARRCASSGFHMPTQGRAPHRGLTGCAAGAPPSPMPMPAMRADSELASSSSSTSSKDVLAATPGGPAAGPSPSSRDAAMMRSFRLLMNASSAAAFSSAAPAPPGHQRSLAAGSRCARLGCWALGSTPLPCDFYLRTTALCPSIRGGATGCQGPQDGPWKPYTAGLLHLPRCSKQALLSAQPLACNFPHSTAQKSAHNASPLPCGSAVCRTPHRT